MRDAVAKGRTAVVVGAGLTGLTAAIELHRAGFDVAVHEAADDVGGRVRTDEVDGFTLDRGFQVYLTAYPEGLRLLDHDALDLRPFETGAIVRRNGAFHKVADPIRRPELILETLRAGIGGFGDKLKVTKLRNRAVQCSLQELWRRPETTALEVLRDIGFSDNIIESFFRPWLGGIFLTRDLDVSSRVMDFVVRMMARGDTALPARGMQAIPRQLAEMLPEGSIHLNSPIRGIEGKTVHLADGTPIEADAIVVGTEAPVAARLLGKPSLDVDARSVTCIYFAADAAPFDDPWLVLNGERDAIVNNLVVPSNVAGEYAPAGAALISATVLDTQGLEGDDLVTAVQNEMRGWYGESADRWNHLRTYTIEHAQPRQDVGFRERRTLARRWEDCVLVACGDYTDSASINGAMLSGRRAADYILNASIERKPVASGAA